MKTRLFALLLVLLLLLTGCAASAPNSATDTAQSAPAYDAGESVYDMPAEEPMAPQPEETTESLTTSTSNGSTTDSAAGSAADTEVSSLAEKIIYSGHASIETTDFDNAIRTLENFVQDCGGFIERSNSGGNTRRREDGTTALVNRWADYTGRVPAEKFDDFMSLTDGIGNVIESGRSAENVTSQYTDYEARLNSLNIQQERLLAMLEQSGDLESLIALEERLSEVRYEIESIERNLRNLDQRLAYSDVSLYINEVEVYTPTVTVQRSFGQKLSDAFSDGWVSFTRGLQRFVINLAQALPALVLWAVIIAVAAIVLCKSLRKRRAKKAEKPETAAEDEKKES